MAARKGDSRLSSVRTGVRSSVRNIVRTLLLNGYVIESFARPAAGASLVYVRKHDALGAEARAVLLFTEQLSAGLRSRLLGQAQRENATPLVVHTAAASVAAGKSVREIKITEFYETLGGEVRTDRIFAKNIRSVMLELGHNRLPPGFAGKPDDLLESYCQECLQFLLECPVRRYGQERLFEPLPDGLALGRNRFNVYFDAKAYGQEFHPSADDIRRFASYVRDFNLRYSSYVGTISLFLIVSGSFSSDRNAILDKVNDFQAECSTPMALIRATDLADLVSECAKDSRRRAAINWRRVFLPQVFDMQRLKDELRRISKDALI
jgi:hypothetical protein